MTNWEKLFGTPERAARTLTKMPCEDEDCYACPLLDALCRYVWESTLEWLESEVRYD